MRILLLLILISTHAFTQQKDTLYIVYSEEKDRIDNYEKHIKRGYFKKYLYRKNVWGFFSPGGFSRFVYDAKKHSKKALTGEYFLKLCVKNKSRVMYELVADTIVNNKGDTIDIDNRILTETEDESREMVYPKPKKPVLDENGEEQVNFDPPPFYYHYIQSFKAYVAEMTKDGRYFLYEVDWIFGFPAE